MGKIEKKKDFVTRFDISNYDTKSERTILVVFNMLILVSVLAGVFTLPYQTYPAPYDSYQTYTLLALLAIYFVRSKLPVNVVRYAKYFWWGTIAGSVLYVNTLAVTGKVDLVVTLLGDLFLFVVPFILYGIMRVTLFKGKK